MKKENNKFLEFPMLLLGIFFLIKIIHLSKLISFFPARDFGSHVARIYLMTTRGYHVFIPDWLNGYILSEIYPPASSFVGEFFYLITNHLLLSLFLLMIFAYVMGFFGFWFLGKIKKWNWEKRVFIFLMFFANPIAIFLFNLTGRVAEMFGWGIFSLLLPAIYYYKENKIDKKFLICFIPIFSVLILSHTITTVLASLLVLGLFIIKNNKERVIIIIGGLASLLISSFWWISMVKNYSNSSISLWSGMTQLASKIEWLFAITTSLLFLFMLYLHYKNKKDLLFYLPTAIVAITYFTKLIIYIPLLNKPFPRTYALFFFLLSLIIFLDLKPDKKIYKKLSVILILIAVLFVAFSFIRYPKFDMSLYQEQSQNIIKTFDYVEGKYNIVSANRFFPKEGIFEYGVVYYNMTSPGGDYWQAKPIWLIELEEKIKEDLRNENCIELKEDFNKTLTKEIISEGSSCETLKKCGFEHKITFGDICLYKL